MKKIQLTEAELNKLIHQVIESIEDELTPDEENPEYSLEEYDRFLDIHSKNIDESLNELGDLYYELANSTTLDPQDKEMMMQEYQSVLAAYGMSIDDGGDDETIDVDYTEVDDEDNV